MHHCRLTFDCLFNRMAEMTSNKSLPVNSRALIIIRNKWSDKAAYFQLFLVCSFPVHVWAYINLLNDMPSIQLEMGTWRILGVASYVLVFAFFESLFVFALIFLVSILLPEKIFGIKFVYVGSLFIFAATIPFLFIHLYSQWEIKSLSFEYWSALWTLIGLAFFVFALYWLNRSLKFQAILQSVIESLAVLSLFYISLDVLGFFLIILRNVVVTL